MVYLRPYSGESYGRNGSTVSDTARRADAWVQWALLIITIIGALWNLSARLATIEQQLHDDAIYHSDEAQRVQKLEEEFNSRMYLTPYQHVVP
jgi:hypothetical protein